MEDLTSALAKVADSINQKRRREIFNVYSNTELFRQINTIRTNETFKKGSKAMRKLATIPMEVDLFFTRIYGPDYYKDPEFFVSKHTEWSVNGSLIKAQDDYLDNSKKVKEMFYTSDHA